MANKIYSLFMVLVFAGTASASLQEKLAAKIEKINVVKQNIRAGKSITDTRKCSKMCRTCKSCTGCLKC
jgi:hypothetical protein